MPESREPILSGAPPEFEADITVVSQYCESEVADATGEIDLSQLVQRSFASAFESRIPALVIQSGTEVGKVVRLDQGPVLLGRDPMACTNVLQDEGVSRRHLKACLLQDGSLSVEDLGSTNGTVLRGHRIREASLIEGEKVLLGRRTVLKYVVLDKQDHAFQQGLYDSTTRDALTRVFNRSFLLNRLSEDLSFAARHGVPVSFLMIDLDHFKAVNDTYGHQSGDLVLQRLAEVFRAALRLEDVLGRYGGEEFGVVARGTTLEGSLMLAEKLRTHAALAEVFTPRDGQAIVVTASIGLVNVHGGLRVSPEQVIETADSNLYKAKEAGRNRVVASLLTSETT
ncbi:MAG: GGDEF domain-containing protein [Myxococcota bacterium]|jgi:diguanylate cyclase (GGDEF)-like protein|nr:GGDEF domain-containing protein [Myxococcota bacterium]